MAVITLIGSVGQQLRERQRIAHQIIIASGLQQDRHADRGDQRRETRRLAQRPVGHAFDRVADQRADHCGDHQRDASADRHVAEAGKVILHDAYG